MMIGIVRLCDHRGPTTVGFHNVPPCPAESLHVVREPGRVRIQKNEFPLPPGTPWLEVLLEESNNVLLSVGATGTRHHGYFERQS